MTREEWNKLVINFVEIVAEDYFANVHNYDGPAEEVALMMADDERLDYDSVREAFREKGDE